jgi:adenylylsulfate kinase
MGLPGSGKTVLTEKLSGVLHCVYFDADEVRNDHGDWDFSPEGRIRQAIRMRWLSKAESCICDFVCPTEELRDIFEADFVIWMDTLDKSRYKDTNQIFETPAHYDVRIQSFDYSVDDVVQRINSHVQ